MVHAQGKTEVVDVTINWIGGYRRQHEIRRSVARYADLRDHDRLIARLKNLRDAGHTAVEIAQQLNADGFHSPQRGHTFNAGTVRSMLSRQGLTRRPHRDAAIDAGFHKPNEWWLEALALEENAIAILRLIQGEFPIVTARGGIDPPRRMVPWQRNAHPANWLPWLESRAGASNHLPVKKKRRFSDFLMPAAPLARGG